MNISLVNKFLVILTVLFMCSGCSVDRPTGPNIFLVTVDTLRWDYLATYGFPESDISPAVDRLARNGTLFRWSQWPAPSTEAEILESMNCPSYSKQNACRVAPDRKPRIETRAATSIASTLSFSIQYDHSVDNATFVR